jgi:hypothetical protein
MRPGVEDSHRGSHPFASDIAATKARTIDAPNSRLGPGQEAPPTAHRTAGTNETVTSPFLSRTASIPGHGGGFHGRRR